MSGEDDYKVGYKKPPREHQFKKGRSGNLKGRPPKHVRGFTERELRRDILNLGEMPTRVRTPDGERTMAAIEVANLRMVQKAMAGHGPSIRRFQDLYRQAVIEHGEVHQGIRDFTEMVEAQNVNSTVEPHDKRFALNFDNEVRRRTRKV